MPRPHPERDAEIVRLYHAEGWSFAALARRYGISRQRVAAIVAASSYLRTTRRRRPGDRMVSVLLPPDADAVLTALARRTSKPGCWR
jgi:hypothetical protein